MPMLAVALMITEQRLNPVIDQMLQRSPGARRRRSLEPDSPGVAKGAHQPVRPGCESRDGV